MARKGEELSNDTHQRAVVGSALWAAAGDALGWITELADERGLKFRVGSSNVCRPISWRRKIGGRFGATVNLPAGTYSDDTQLRLAVGRAIRSNGDFDVEAFAKVELPVWQSYALGAGKGTMAAAANLSKANVAWFSNFYEGRGTRGYFHGGGNGAAMRIQPHVWKCRPGATRHYLADVLRDSIVTHGHPRGFCGAALHAFALEHALSEKSFAAPLLWSLFIRELASIPAVVAKDEQLSLFWLDAWEEGAEQSLQVAVDEQIDDALRLVSSIEGLLGSDPHEAYHAVLSRIGGFREETRGGGIETALASMALVWLFRDEPNEKALAAAAGELSSDTDTIATMAGALLGAVRPDFGEWPVQDKEYIKGEATRLANIAFGKPEASFNYPNILGWQPPQNQSDAVGQLHEAYAVAGLGYATTMGETWTAGDIQWQWLKLDYGQTILAKRRISLRKLTARELPISVDKMNASEREALNRMHEKDQQKLPLLERKVEKRFVSVEQRQPSPDENLDELTDWVIRNEFTPESIGKAFLRIMDSRRPIEDIVAFSAILAKAVSARKKRSTR